MSIAEQREENRQVETDKDARSEAKKTARGVARKMVREQRERESIEAMRARVRTSRAKRALHRQAAAVVADEEEQRQREDLAPVSRQQERAVEQQRRKLMERRLSLLQRDDEVVRAIVQREKRVDGIMSADSATDADELLWLIVERLGLLESLTALHPPPTRINAKSGKRVKRRTMYPPMLLNLLSVLGRFLGASSNEEMAATLLTDEAWMSLLGFNIAQVHEGSTRRSSSLLGKSREGAGGKFVDAGEHGPARAREGGPRGALSAQTLAGHESALSQQEAVEFFNKVVQALAKAGFFSASVRTVLDSTGEEVVPTFTGAGVVRKKVKVKQKVRRPKAVEVHVRGFKVWFLMEVKTGIPVAMTLAPIETAEVTPVKALVLQAKQNLAGYAVLENMAVDRGFLDGDLLWWLEHEEKIGWVCPSKENMVVTMEARDRLNTALAALGEPGETPLTTAQRAARNKLTHEGVGFYAKKAEAGHDPLVLAQVDDLRCTDFYGEGGSSSSRVHSKAFTPTPLHATVVLSWPDKSKHEREDAAQYDEPSKGPLVLLSARRQTPLFRFERYDERSLIENWVNRDGKQHFGLGESLARNEQAMWSATVFSAVALALYRALSIEKETSMDALDQRCEVLGVLRYRRQNEKKNRSRVIVVVDDLYTIMPRVEFAAMLGCAVR